MTKEGIDTEKTAVMEPSPASTIAQHPISYTPGQTIPALPSQRYSRGDIIAKGGMSLIHKIYDHYLLRHTAQKTLLPNLSEDPTITKRFMEEARITGQLEHPNIISVYDLGQKDENFYFQMQFIEGQTFEEYLRSNAHDVQSDFSLFSTLQIFLRICDAISYAHSKGVIHRDLKPGNVMVGDHGQVYVMDWGIAYLLPDGPPISQELQTEKTVMFVQRDIFNPPSLEVEGDILGTWNYMPPEQAFGQTEHLGIHSDIFTLGGILYEILTGHSPYSGDNPYQVLQLAQAAEVTHPQARVPHIHLPQSLCNIAMKALQKQPIHRYTTVKELKADVETFLRSGGQLPSQNYEAGTTIIREGDEGTTAYIVIQGQCEMYRFANNRKISIRNMGPGDVFGEMSLFKSERHRFNVTASENVTLAILNRQDYSQKIFQDSWLGRYIQALGARCLDNDRKALRQRQTLEQAKLKNQLLFYIYYHTLVDKRGAPWKALAKSLSQQVSGSYQQILQLVQSLNLFTIDLENDRISISPSVLHTYLTAYNLPL